MYNSISNNRPSRSPRTQNQSPAEMYTQGLFLVLKIWAEPGKKSA
jgi:hypothetical protein